MFAAVEHLGGGHGAHARLRQARQVAADAQTLALQQEESMRYIP